MLSYARVCIEIKATQATLENVEVFLNNESWSVKVEYEWQPLACSKCGTFGHKCADLNVLAEDPTRRLPIPEAPTEESPTLPDDRWETVLKHHSGDISRKSANLPSRPTRLDPPHLSHPMEKLDDQIPVPDISPASSRSSSEEDDSQDDKASNISSDSEEGPTVMLTKRSRVKSHSMAETSKPDIVPAPRDPSPVPKIIPAKGGAPSETILANPKARNRGGKKKTIGLILFLLYVFWNLKY